MASKCSQTGPIFDDPDDHLVGCLETLWHFGHTVVEVQEKSPSSKSNQQHHLIADAGNHSLQALFRVLDEDGDGQVSLDEMQSLLRKLGKEQVSRACLVSLIESSSPLKHVRRDDELLAMDFSQFAVLYESLFGQQEDDEEEEALLDAFHVYDRDRDGFITASELAAVLVELGLLAAPAQEGMADHVHRCQALIDRVDSDGNGVVDLQEFKGMLATTRPIVCKTNFYHHQDSGPVR